MCVAVCCSVLQCLQCAVYHSVCCSVLQCVAVCCSVCSVLSIILHVTNQRRYECIHAPRYVTYREESFFACVCVLVRSLDMMTRR